MEKVIIEYDIPIQDKEDCDRQNKLVGDLPGYKPLKTTKEHLNLLVNKLVEAIDKVGNDGGWYLGDGIKVKIEVEYDPENK